MLTKAEWEDGDRQLKVEANGTGEAAVIVRDAATGAVLASKAFDVEGDLKERIDLDTSTQQVPCRLRITSERASSELVVKDAPDRCEAF